MYIFTDSFIIFVINIYYSVIVFITYFLLFSLRLLLLLLCMALYWN